MFCRDSKLLVMEKMRRQFCIGPYGRFAIRLLLRSAVTDNIRIYTVYSIQTVNGWGKIQRRRLFECRVIRAHICLYIGRHWRLISKGDFHKSI